MEDLPEAVLKHVCSFVGNALDFLHCERTSKTFRDALKSDDIWATCEECKPQYQNQQAHWPTTNREKAFVVRALVQCDQWQRGTRPVILGVLSVRQWKEFLSEVFGYFLKRELWHNASAIACCDEFFWRGDSSALLMTIVQESLVSQLQKANSIAFHSALPDTYPCLRGRDLRLQDQLANRDTLVPHQSDQPTFDRFIAYRLIDHAQRHRIVRRFAYLAGVTKMEDSLTDLVWASMCCLIGQLMRPACVQLGFRCPVEGQQKLLHGQTIRDVPPFSEFGDLLCEACFESLAPTRLGRRIILHTIVPKQLEEAAKALGLPRTYYGPEEWHVDSELLNLDRANAARLRKQEIAQASSKYCFGEGYAGSIDEESHTSDDVESQANDSVDDGSEETYANVSDEDEDLVYDSSEEEGSCTPVPSSYI
jgi:hypothetical protein